jgi:predicted O-methyltransferase YrrM
MTHGSQRAKQSLQALQALQALPDAPHWVQGATPSGDREFLLEMITTHAPECVVEIGVAAGVSSAVMLCALDTLPQTATGRVLYSCDIQSTCYFDASRATGEAVQAMYPHPRARWILDTNKDARRVSQALAPSSVDLTFIDANHYHPWPLLDLLHLTKLAKRGSWVMLHDINLPVIAPEFVASGAKWLFDEWPFEKVAGGGTNRNIGAVKLPADLRSLIPFASVLLDRPWEFAPTAWHVALPEPFSPIQTMLIDQIERGA